MFRLWTSKATIMLCLDTDRSQTDLVSMLWLQSQPVVRSLNICILCAYSLRYSFLGKTPVDAPLQPDTEFPVTVPFFHLIHFFPLTLLSPKIQPTNPLKRHSLACLR